MRTAIVTLIATGILATSTVPNARAWAPAVCTVLDASASIVGGSPQVAVPADPGAAFARDVATRIVQRLAPQTVLTVAAGTTTSPATWSSEQLQIPAGLGPWSNLAGGLRACLSEGPERVIIISDLDPDGLGEASRSEQLTDLRLVSTESSLPRIDIVAFAGEDAEARGLFRALAASTGGVVADVISGADAAEVVDLLFPPESPPPPDPTSWLVPPEPTPWSLPSDTAPSTSPPVTTLGKGGVPWERLAAAGAALLLLPALTLAARRPGLRRFVASALPRGNPTARVSRHRVQPRFATAARMPTSAPAPGTTILDGAGAVLDRVVEGETAFIRQDGSRAATQEPGALIFIPGTPLRWEGRQLDFSAAGVARAGRLRVVRPR